MKALLLLPAAVLVGAMGAAPLLAMLLVSFWSVDDMLLVPDLAVRAWLELVGSATIWGLIGRALGYGTLTVLLCAALAYPIALAMTRLPPMLKGAATVVLLTPLYMGEIVRIYAWRILLGVNGPINAILVGTGLLDEPSRLLLFTPVATVIALVYNNLPFMTVAIWLSAERVEPRLVEAARDLGARPQAAFRRVWLPLTSPGLLAGSLAVFALAAGDQLTPALLGGTSGATAMSMIDSLFGVAFDWPLAAALAWALLLLLLAAALVAAVASARLRATRAALRAGR